MFVRPGTIFTKNVVNQTIVKLAKSMTMDTNSHFKKGNGIFAVVRQIFYRNYSKTFEVFVLIIMMSNVFSYLQCYV